MSDRAPARAAAAAGPSLATQQLQRCPSRGHACSTADGCGGELQRSAVDGRAADQAPASVHEVLRSPGRPLDGPVRAGMETRLGHDFSHVRVHSDTRAGESAAAVGAAAYTVGRHVVFAPGRYTPATAAGRQLIAHELTHVVQQHGAGTAGPIAVGPVDGPAEAEAHRIGAGGPGRPTRLGRAVVQLQRVAACMRHLSLRGFSDIATGIAVHAQIKQHFVRRKRPSKQEQSLQIPGASAEPMKTEESETVIAPQIFDPVFGGYGVPDLAKRSRAGRVLLVAEIKPATLAGAVFGEGQVANYIDKGNRDEQFKEDLGISAVAPMLSGFYTPPRLIVVGARRFRVLWCGPGLIVYKEIKKRRRKRRSDKRRRRRTPRQRKPQTTRKTTRTGKQAPKQAPKAKTRAPASAKAANFGFGISIGSSGMGAGNVGVGISINSQGVAVGTVGAGVVYNSQGVAVGAIGAGAAVESQSAAALAAGAGVAVQSQSAAALAAGAGTAVGSSTAGVLVAGAGSIEGVTGAAALEAGTGSAEGPTGGEADAGVEGAAGAGGEGPAEAGATGEIGDAGVPAPAGVPAAGAGAGAGPAAGRVGPGEGGGGLSPSPTPAPGPAVLPLDEIVARLNLPPAAGTPSEIGELLVDAAELDRLVGLATPAQTQLLRLLAGRSTEGVYAIPRPEWVATMLSATAGMTEADLEHLAGLEWDPARVSADTLRESIRKALAARRAAEAGDQPEGGGGPGPEPDKGKGKKKGRAGGKRGGIGDPARRRRKRREKPAEDAKQRERINQMVVEAIRKIDYRRVANDSWKATFDTAPPAGEPRDLLIYGLTKDGIKWALFAKAVLGEPKERVVRIDIVSCTAVVSEHGEEFLDPGDAKAYFTVGELDQ